MFELSVLESLYRLTGGAARCFAQEEEHRKAARSVCPMVVVDVGNRMGGDLGWLPMASSCH